MGPWACPAFRRPGRNEAKSRDLLTRTFDYPEVREGPRGSEKHSAGRSRLYGRDDGLYRHYFPIQKLEKISPNN